MYDRVQQHPINKQLQEQLLTQEMQPERYQQQLRAQADATAAGWMQRLQGWPLLPDAIVLLPRVVEVMEEFEDNLQSLMNHYKVHDVGEYHTHCMMQCSASDVVQPAVQCATRRLRQQSCLD
jgi:hypothetical protein